MAKHKRNRLKQDGNRGKTIVYALTDPTTSELRYIGHTRQPNRRFSHFKNPGDSLQGPLADWCRELKRNGMEPRVHILCEVTATGASCLDGSGAWSVGDSQSYAFVVEQHLIQRASLFTDKLLNRMKYPKAAVA